MAVKSDFMTPRVFTTTGSMDYVHCLFFLPFHPMLVVEFYVCMPECMNYLCHAAFFAHCVNHHVLGMYSQSQNSMQVDNKDVFMFHKRDVNAF